MAIKATPWSGPPVITPNNCKRLAKAGATTAAGACAPKLRAAARPSGAETVGAVTELSASAPRPLDHRKPQATALKASAAHTSMVVVRNSSRGSRA